MTKPLAKSPIAKMSLMRPPQRAGSTEFRDKQSQKDTYEAFKRYPWSGRSIP